MRLSKQLISSPFSNFLKEMRKGVLEKKEEGCLFRDKMMRYGLENSCLS